MKSEDSLPCSQEPSTGPYPEPEESSSYHPIPSLYRVSEKSGTNEKFNYFSYFYRLKLKVKRLKRALTLDERVETVHFGDSRRHRCMLFKSEIFVTLGRKLQAVVLLSTTIC
jgi:hypothetical protein